MQKTLFSKHFITIVAIILLSITILGAVLMAFASQYFKQDRYKLLQHNVEQAANFTLKDFADHDYRAISADIIPMYGVLANAIEADIYLVDIKGTALVFQQPGSPHAKTPVSQEILARAFENNGYREYGKMGGIYAERHYTVGIPIRNDLGQPAAVIFASASGDTLSYFLTEILKMFVVSAMAVLILAFAAVYFITGDLVRPLRKMVAATQSFSKGDFTMRVPVESCDEIGQLAISINNMASSLASLESVRRSFTANVSHELRTPMTTIGGFIDGILDGTIPEEKRDQYLLIVSQEIKRLSRLVRSMLNIARIEAGELQIKPSVFDVNQTVTQTVFTFEKPLEEKEIEVRGLDHDRVMVEADPDLIHQVVYNLLENAVKFCNQGGYIEADYQEDDSATQVSIKNSGEGIAKSEIPHVFDRFYKTDKSRSQDKGGAGLGLHIVRSIINLHGGDIIVRSVEGEYCEFLFSIPKAKQPKTKKVKGKNEPEPQPFTKPQL